jgi:cytochrome c oxidase subunit 3
MVFIMGGVVWWTIRQTIGTTPWTAEESTQDVNDIGFVSSHDGIRTPSMKIGLGVFLAVATSVFALFVSAYLIRMEINDWRPLAEPALLWANTVLLVLSSICLQWGVFSGRRNDPGNMAKGLLGGGVFAIAFLVGQLMAWDELVAAGMYLTTNPANTFFYLLTCIHGLHLLGGLYVWAKTMIRSRSQANNDRVLLGVELCAVYWHFLLVIWLVLFALLSST